MLREHFPYLSVRNLNYIFLTLSFRTYEFSSTTLPTTSNSYIYFDQSYKKNTHHSGH
ncbi:hypothetical protein J6TS2_05470 [Heyndrickxia sporothermodurans]|nr:hypothetical protein J6TS2_05470 [Heyndrickxia sporothermodurans]